MKKSLFVFDFDNTVAQSLPLCFECFRIVFYTYNKETLSDEEIEALFGPSEVDIIRKRVAEDVADEAVELYYWLYRDLHEHYMQSADSQGIIDLVHQLKQRDKTVAMFTGKARRSLEISLDKLGLNPYFDFVITDDEIVKSKPDPEGLFKVMEHYQATKAETVFVGDSDGDMIGARDAGVTSVGVNWFAKRDFQVEPDIISNVPEDFLDNFS